MSPVNPKKFSPEDVLSLFFESPLVPIDVTRVHWPDIYSSPSLPSYPGIPPKIFFGKKLTIVANLVGQ